MTSLEVTDYAILAAVAKNQQLHYSEEDKAYQRCIHFGRTTMRSDTSMQIGHSESTCSARLVSTSSPNVFEFDAEPPASST
jgi:hypothetical protein